MAGAACHACSEEEAERPLQKARELLLKKLGVRRVAHWCGVSEDAVYQWLSRGRAEEPMPPVHVPKIVAGAKAEGITFDVTILWPAMSGMLPEAAP